MKLTKISLIALALVVITAAVIMVIKSTGKPAPQTQTVQNLDLKYALSPSKTVYNVGDKITVPVYLAGVDAGRVTAFDIKFAYDNTKLKLDSAVPGNFLAKYITVKWDTDSAWFALALSPTNPRTDPQPSAAVMTLEFTALAKTSSSSVSTGVSTVYVTKTGGFHPQTGTVDLTIN